MGRMSHRNQERTERRISAAASLMLCALTVLAQIAVTLLLTRFLKEKASFVYGFLQLIGAAVAIRVYQRSGSPSYKLSWMCLLLILPVAGMLLFCLWGGTHQAKQLSLKPVPPIPQRESAKMLSDLNQTALTRRSPAWGRLAAYLQKRQFWLYRNTDAAYFGEGESFFRDLVEHLRQAETYIFMEYYILAEGTVWDEIFAVLKERAAAGVEIHLIIDVRRASGFVLINSAISSFVIIAFFAFFPNTFSKLNISLPPFFFIICQNIDLFCSCGNFFILSETDHERRKK